MNRAQWNVTLLRAALLWATATSALHAQAAAPAAGSQALTDAYVVYVKAEALATSGDYAGALAEYRKALELYVNLGGPSGAAPPAAPAPLRSPALPLTNAIEGAAALPDSPALSDSMSRELAELRDERG